MIVLFSASKGPMSFLIRLWTWSRWSHVAILDGDHVIESLGGVGVVRTPLLDFCRRVKRFTAVRYPHVNEAGVLAFAHAQLGKKYDWGAIFGIMFRRNWGDGDKWSCVELAAVAAQAANTPVLRCEASWRFHPQHLWLVPGETVSVRMKPVLAF